ncbi:ribonuclease P/MRP protein subunit RPP1 [Methanohalophilus levihalophilus]|uniref:ribonuclease P protein component 3 n=1 Tax=Methanohalophilus levihalophilus TaxID=1431282 RepID=UPI001FD8CF51|nr:ribonuclease P protein component 3 [Methanohalophilus levihalophilus]MBP2029407.1 ribonuclease P/MRP protein subunit RPP1 [Methanohalophilus levihalophilus]
MPHKYYDLCIHSSPEGEHDCGQMLAMAQYLGYSGVCISNHSDSIDPDIPAGGGSINVCNGIEIRVSKPSKLHGLIGKYRTEKDVIIVHGGTESINRAAVENPNVDVLNHPFTQKDSGMNHVLAKEAAENNVALAFNVDILIQLKGGKRVYALSNFRNNLQLARKYDVPILLTTNAMSIYDLRAPREVIALAGLFGMTFEEATAALSDVPAGIISRNRRLAGSVCDGVRVIGTEGDVL